MKHLIYSLRHKWFVFWECWKLGIPFLGITHDWSKFLPSEYIPYLKYFSRNQPRDKVGYYKPVDTGDSEFERAWFHHVRGNKHHWQYWVVSLSPKEQRAVQIPERYLREMLADWRGAGKAQGTPDTLLWYETHKDDMLLHHDSRRWLEDALGFSGLTVEEEKILEERLRGIGCLD